MSRRYTEDDLEFLNQKMEWYQEVQYTIDDFLKPHDLWLRRKSEWTDRVTLTERSTNKPLREFETIAEAFRYALTLIERAGV